MVIPGPTHLAARAIKQRLQVAFPADRFEFALLPAKLEPRMWAEFMRRTTFIGLGWNGTTSKAQAKTFHGDLTFTVVLVTTNEGGVDRRYFGDAIAPGLFDMTDAAIAVLNGVQVPNLGTIYVDRVANSFSEGLDAVNAVATLDLRVQANIGIGSVVTGPDLVAGDMLTAQWTWPYDDGRPNGMLVVIDETETQ